MTTENAETNGFTLAGLQKNEERQKELEMNLELLSTKMKEGIDGRDWIGVKRLLHDIEEIEEEYRSTGLAISAARYHLRHLPGVKDWRGL